MELNNDLITQFAKIATIKPKDKSATTVRGTIHISEGRNYITIDGAAENSMTPVETTVELNEGDRVIAVVKDHGIVVTGNKTHPAIGTMTEGNLRSEIKQTADAINMTVSANYSDLDTRLGAEVNARSEGDRGLSNRITNTESTFTQRADQIQSTVTSNYNTLDGKISAEEKARSEGDSGLDKRITSAESKITQTATEITTEVRAKFQSLDGNDERFTKFIQDMNSFTFMGNGGTVKLTGGDINLTGAITWSELDTDTQEEIKKGEDALKKFNNLSIPSLPSYITSTYIDGSSVNSPAIRGGLISGARFTNLTGTIENPTYDHWLEIGDSDGHYGFTFSSEEYGQVFAVYNGDFGYITLHGKRGWGTTGDILTHDASTGKIEAQGVTWDFSNVTVAGLPAAEIDPLDAWPVGSIYLAYNHTSPASLFGGKWTRISPYFLYAAGSSANIGDTGYMAMADGGGVLYVKISAWRRTS